MRDEGLDRGELAADRVEGSDEVVAGDDEAAATVVHDVRPLARRQPLADGHRDHADLRRAEVAGEVLEAVRREHAVAVPETEPRRHERVGERLGHRVELAVGHRPRAVPQRGRVGPAPGVVLEHVMEPHAAIVARAATPGA